MKNNWITNLKSDIPASIVVFFVALPLCLGIALASGAPLFSGLIAGIIGGVVVGALSGSKLGVSGPAAGLAAIVLTAIGTLGSFENFLVAVVLGGALQIIFGLLRAGVIAYYFPSSVIKGMLTGIGVIIILKQIPHFFGYDNDPEGDFAFFQVDGANTFSELFNTLNEVQPGPTLIGVLALCILLLWDKVLSKKGKIFTIIQGPLVAVFLGILFFVLTESHDLLRILEVHLVSVPVPDSIDSFIGQFSFPNFAAITNPQVWTVAFTIALVASLETLLCVEATDKIDPDKNVTPTNRELLAQGVGNMLSGFIGGLPVTQVIVRSSANIQSGGKTKLAAILHGFLLLISVILIPNLLNKIPLSVLAAILLIVGYKLAKPALFVKMFKLGWNQFLPFVITVVGIVFTDLLVGIGLGLVVGIFVILIQNYKNSHYFQKENEGDNVHNKITFAEEVTFFNKGAIMKQLDQLPNDSFLKLDLSNSKFIDHDIIDILEDFVDKAKAKNIQVELHLGEKLIKNPTNYIDLLNK